MASISGYLFGNRRTAEDEPLRTLTFSATMADSGIELASRIEGEDAQLTTLHPDHPLYPYFQELIRTLDEEPASPLRTVAT